MQQLRAVLQGKDGTAIHVSNAQSNEPINEALTERPGTSSRT